EFVVRQGQVAQCASAGVLDGIGVGDFFIQTGVWYVYRLLKRDVAGVEAFENEVFQHRVQALGRPGLHQETGQARDLDAQLGKVDAGFEESNRRDRFGTGLRRVVPTREEGRAVRVSHDIRAQSVRHKVQSAVAPTGSYPLVHFDLVDRAAVHEVG